MKLINKYRLITVITIALLYATGSYVTTAYASDGSWELDGAQAPVNLSTSGMIRRPALAISPDGEVAAVWASDERAITTTRGIFGVVGAGQPITPSTMVASAQGQYFWAPDVTYQGDQLFFVWLQSSGIDPRPGALVQQDGFAGTPQTVMSPTFGYTTPRLLTGHDRLHLFFTSAIDRNKWTQADLYYTQRQFDVAGWITPTIIITHAQANPPDGGIWYPHAALSADKNEVHLLWEQSAGALDTLGIWYTYGTWQALTEDFTWANLTRLSLTDQESVRPKIAIDETDCIHVAWVEQQVVQVGENYIMLQHIVYRRRENGEWIPPLEQPAQRLDPIPIQVNALRPTFSNIAIDVHGGTICIAWHGFRGPLGVSGLEDIFLKCSHNGGATWPAQATNASETASLSLFPALRLDGHGAIHLAWEEYQGGPDFSTNYDTYYRQGPFPRTRIYLPLLMRSWRHG